MGGPEVTVARMFEEQRATLELVQLNPPVALDRPIGDPDVSGPGLALAGYVERFASERIRVFGETEMTYLETLDEATARTRAEAVFARRIPCAVVSKDLAVPRHLIESATRYAVPLFRSSATTRSVFRRLSSFLERALAPRASLHGSLADVYGVGLLLIGESGIGKSECVLDLVERGHRLVADDLVLVTRRGEDVLIGRGHELQRHHMEIRGVGIIDVRTLFGVRATRQQKRIEVVVQLEQWDDGSVYDRTGLVREETQILGVNLPRVVVPLNPGKNVGVISEVVAMNHLLRYAGIDSAAEFHHSLAGSMDAVQEYLAQDYE